MECKTTLRKRTERRGVVTILRKRGWPTKNKRELDGLIDLVHNGKIGVMVEVNCETISSRGTLISGAGSGYRHDIAASDPRFVSKEDVTEDVLAKERTSTEQAKASGKPEGVDKIVEGRVAKYYAEACLLEQPFVKEPSVSVRDHIASHIQKIGETSRCGASALQA